MNKIYERLPIGQWGLDVAYTNEVLSKYGAPRKISEMEGRLIDVIFTLLAKKLDTSIATVNLNIRTDEIRMLRNLVYAFFLQRISIPSGILCFILGTPHKNIQYFKNHELKKLADKEPFKTKEQKLAFEIYRLFQKQEKVRPPSLKSPVASEIALQKRMAKLAQEVAQAEQMKLELL